MASEFVEGFVGAVLDDNERYGQLELHRRGQTLNCIHGRAITQDRNDLFARPAQRDADRRGQTMAETAAGASVKGIFVGYWQVVVHGPAAAGRFFNDDASWRAQSCNLLQQVFVREASAGQRRWTY